MIKTDKFRAKLKVELDGEPWMMVTVDHVRPGKGQGFVRTKLKNLVTGMVIERTFKSGEVVNPAAIQEDEMQFLYENGGEYSFMNNKTYEQVALTRDQVGEAVDFLYENMLVAISFFKGAPISCDIPNFVELEITECEPGIKGNSATNKMKPAILSTGFKVNVPLFVEQNQWIRVDTRTGEYVERCQKPEDR